ncbi:putative histone-lysine N-methyltransferase chromatin remodeling SET family [Helianthus annuus]|uniref:Histone-lysine N-methyltransferase chromatin remodeling SET family n=1 Tax=Helianthus annuus TaxID=4232 RepID=A0A9K3NYN7_HELAN|nr:histone-lysine N-methyltransferase, H3 lysine-9 specific SUVH3-like [Helianthus annuus]XP_035843640.1 histone-lysine N-methyltransferase, H3 lysine-9 specific SUVH3-like [Helianthus annuus]XP_035843641.1 histone-lysine N-methyltransferase, H3 lysine-9 specific SUVH3-like [Helianthus annuus]KAF5816293.1 putative histone-lysine N-methyltransferase chromatin remodeling SET family [Helianthus annuus]KAJ0769707.1 putative [histone H3]-lysine(4) N-trimethyltransferase chromatin remodeling SET fami
MVVMSIKISDGNVPKSRNENGNCSVNVAPVRPVKWKRRHVSCVRDFPPGCGPVPIAVVPTVSSPVVDNHEGTDAPVDVVVPREAELVSSPVADNRVASDAPINVVVVPREAGPVVGNHVASDAPIDVVVPCEAEPVVGNHVASDAPIDVVVPREAEPVVGDHVASDAPIDVVVPREGEPVSSPVVDGHVNSEAGSGEAVGSNVGNLVNDVVRNGDVKADNGVSVVPEARRRMKYKPRKVCAVRDFPPFCGPNAPEPTEEDRRRINGMKSCVNESNRGVNGDLVKKTRSDESNEASVTKQEMQMIVESKTYVENARFESSKKVQNIGQACQELVVYTLDKDMQIVSSADARDVDCDEDARDNTPLSIIQKDMNVNNREAGSKRHVKKRPSDGTKDFVFMGDKIKVVIGLKAPSLCTRETKQNSLTKEAKGRTSITPKKIEEKFVGESSFTKAANTGTLEKVEKDLTNKVKGDASMTPKKSIKKKQKKATVASALAMVVRNEEDSLTDIEVKEGFLDLQGTDDVYVDVDVDVDVSLPPFGPRSSNNARNKVREALQYFQFLCRKLLRAEEAKTNDANSKKKRVDLEAKAQMEKRGRTLVLGDKTYGPVPGVEVGDEFQYRVELFLVGIHRLLQGGIDYVKKGNKFFAVSVVASGGYDNEVDKPDCLMYSGAGGVGKDKSYENQKLERGNLALKNNVDLKYPVRVIRGYKVKPPESSDSNNKVLTTYIYDGLYTVESCNQVTGPKGNMVFKFELKRVPGQPQLAIREVMSKKYKKREGVCVKDISDGKEKFPICAINTIDDEKPPAFTYITKIMYPDWYKPIPPEGCDCVGRCSEKKCPCAFKNGGEIPYNRNGAIVEPKTLVYECGPLCKCPPSCYNRVTQHGMKIHLEIFKTESRGWGVRSLSSISSGSFICEYVGELLEESEAEERKGKDEYLFDIGQNYNDCSLNPDTNPVKIANTGDGFTIDAADYGNIGRFINHSCSPNLYAQNVLYDEDDKRMPHIMLFATENIPPLQELTYHYNYAVDEVHDAEGNVKVKSCYCGSSECTGRLY